jgi:hypothetical protein
MPELRLTQAEPYAGMREVLARRRGFFRVAAPIQPLRERTPERRADEPAKVPIVTKRAAQALHGKRR